MGTPNQAHEHLYKILVIGDFGVGKTSIIRRYTENIFSPNYKLTIGVDFSLKSLTWSSGLKINLQLWDIAGHERFGHMTRVYYKYAIGAIIVFDLTRQVTFESVSKWLGDVNQKVLLENGQPVPVLVLANKCDVENQQVGHTQVEEFCSKHNLLGWFSTSAKEGTNITKAMEALVTRILELSSNEPDCAPEGLGPQNTTTDQDRLTPNPTNTYSSNGTNDITVTDSTGYSKVSNMKGLVGHIPHSDQQRRQSSSCC